VTDARFPCWLLEANGLDCVCARLRPDIQSRPPPVEGYGRDVMLHSMQLIRRMVGTELQTGRDGTEPFNQRLVQYRLFLAKRNYKMRGS